MQHGRVSGNARPNSHFLQRTDTFENLVQVPLLFFLVLLQGGNKEGSIEC